jgi:PilZ domain
MGSDRRLTGREERRLPIMMEVTLAPIRAARRELRERTYTDNISPHGIRVNSTVPWQLGEQVEITPTKGENAMQGEVVYCQKLGNGRFFVGLKFAHGRVPWSILQRFNGLAH